MPSITTTRTDIIYSSAAGSDTLQNAVDLAQSSGLPLFIAPGVYTEASVTITGTTTFAPTQKLPAIRLSAPALFRS